MELMDMKVVTIPGKSNESHPIEVGSDPVLFEVFEPEYTLHLKGRVTGNQVFRLTAGKAIWQVREVTYNDRTSVVLERIF